MNISRESNLKNTLSKFRRETDWKEEKLNFKLIENIKVVS